MRLIMGEMSGCLAADIVSYCFCCCLNRFVDKFKEDNNYHYIIIIYYCFCCCLNRFIVMRLWCGRQKWQRWLRFVIDDNDKDGNDNDDDRSMRKILIMLISSCLLRLLGSKGLNCKMDGKVRSLSILSLLCRHFTQSVWLYITLDLLQSWAGPWSCSPSAYVMIFQQLR